jgi:hypothetical protein
VKIGRDDRLAAISGEILPDNVAMKHVSRRAGFRLQHPSGESVIKAELEL